MRKIIHLSLLGATLLTLTGCGGSSEPQVQYVPFRDSDNGLWGMVSPDGDVLFSEEFTQQPTLVYNERFFITNKDGLTEIYTADKKPRQVGDAYKDICPFTEDVTPAVKPDGVINLIDRDGNVAVELDKLEGKTVETAGAFLEGRSVVSNGELCGAIDTKGRLVVPFKYKAMSVCNNGYFLAIDKKYTDEASAVISILDRDGKEAGRIKTTKYQVKSEEVQPGGLIICGFTDDSDRGVGLLQIDGEWRVKPSSRVQSIGQVRGDCFTYYDGDKWGLMNLDGEKKVRPKYDDLGFASDELLFAKIDDKWRLLDLDGERVGTEEWDDVTIPFYLTGGHALVKSEGEWTFINTKGEANDKVEYREMGGASFTFQVTRDYVDYAGILADLNITTDGLGGINFGQTAKQIARALDKDDASEYEYNRTMVKEMHSSGVDYWVNAEFSSAPVSAITHTENTGYYSYEVTDGYQFNDQNPFAIYVDFAAYGKNEGKDKQIFEAMNKVADRLGRLDKDRSTDDLKIYSAGSRTILVTSIDGRPTLSILNAAANSINPSGFVSDESLIDDIPVALPDSTAF